MGIKRKSDLSQEQLDRLLQYFHSGQLEKAEDLAISLSNQFPGSQLPWQVLGAVLKQTGRKHEALRIFQTCVNRAPLDPGALNNLGEVLREVGELEKSEETLKRAILHQPNLAGIHYNLGNTLIELGKLEEAEISLKKATSLSPEFSSAHNNLANALYEQGKLKEAEISYQRAITLQPNDSQPHHNLGKLLLESGNPKLAKNHFERAVSLRPKFYDSLVGLGNTHYELGRFDEACSAYALALELKPDSGDCHYNLGKTQEKLGEFQEAAVSFRQAILCNPNHLTAHLNLGVMLQETGRLQEAEEALKQSLVIDPNFFLGHVNLANLYQVTKKFKEAELNYITAIGLQQESFEAYINYGEMLRKLCRSAESENMLRKALELRPNAAEGHYNLGVTLCDMARWSDAEFCFRQSLALKPDNPSALSSLGILLRDQNIFMEAKTIYAQALALDPESGHALQGKATLLSYMSDYREATSLSDAALELAEEDDLPTVWELRLYLWIYHPDLSAEEIRDEHIRWGKHYARLGQKGFPNHDRDPSRRLKIGYVSPDFRGHTCRFYFSPLFSSHDHEKVELFAYSNVLMEDEHTSQMKTYFHEWRDIRALSDEAVAEIIRQDKIDILVDGCGHMRDTRLKVFAHKPAPIQVTWLGSAWTTGLPQMDYVLFDQHMAPEGTATSEKIVRLPRTWAAFQPGDKAMQSVVKPLPASSNGHVTFGYSGRTERLNYKVFNVWARILNRLPQARLILDYKPFADSETSDYFRGFLEEHGVDTSRVVMRYSTDIFEGLGDIDILLDSFPHSGGTMLFDAIWMGVPAVTLASSRPVGRIGASLMRNLGLPAWVGNSEKEYEDKAVAFAQDVHVLSELRSTMRERMQTSPIMDGRSFAKDVENAYQNMWQKWIFS